MKLSRGLPGLSISDEPGCKLRVGSDSQCFCVVCSEYSNCYESSNRRRRSSEEVVRSEVEARELLAREECSGARDKRRRQEATNLVENDDEVRLVSTRQVRRHDVSARQFHLSLARRASTTCNGQTVREREREEHYTVVAEVRRRTPMSDGEE